METHLKEEKKWDPRGMDFSVGGWGEEQQEQRPWGRFGLGMFQEM